MSTVIKEVQLFGHKKNSKKNVYETKINKKYKLFSITFNKDGLSAVGLVKLHIIAQP